MKQVLLVLFLLCLVMSASSAMMASTITFETLIEGAAPGTNFAGVTFSAATVLTAGSGLNEVDFPPHSGTNVIADLSGPITVDFTSPVTSVSAYLTYAATTTLQVYDSSNTLLGTYTSLFGANYVASGNSPNELFSLSSASGISRAVFSGDPAGGSFVLDDLSFTGATSIPEPSSLLLAGAGMLLFAKKLRR